MQITIALAGNPNCGKTTMFNELTGSTQYVGNWPGVTVEKKGGKLKWDKEVSVTDLPGIYSLSPYTLEEVVSRDYLLKERPDVIINLVDATNLERNLYLTTQLAELGIPMVIALNMMDLVRKNGDRIDGNKLSKALGCPVIETSALKGDGLKQASETAVSLAIAKKTLPYQHCYSEDIENVLGQISQMIQPHVHEEDLRFYSVKLLERDEKILEELSISEHTAGQIEQAILSLEEKLDDDSASIMTNERYSFITKLMKDCVHKKKRKLTASDQIDRVVTNRWLALPIFAVVMYLVYFISVTTVGTFATDWANDGVFGDGWHLFGIGSSEYELAMEDYEAQYEEVFQMLGISLEEAENLEIETGIKEPDPADYGIWVPGIPVLIGNGLEAAQSPEWLNSLVLDGIVGGVGAVLGFLPQMLILFLLLSLLEDCGYMARVAFIMDRIFRKFGLSGKSFIPMLISSGCGVPGIMASRTIENEKDRKMTIMLTTFIPCGAKLPVIALIGGAMLGGASWIAPACYFIGVLMIILSGIILKKTRLFRGDPAPFVMELPQYHLPGAKGIFIHTWDRGKAFIAKAGTVIFIACGVIWFLSSFGFDGGSFGMVETEASLLAMLGNAIAWVFAPLGFGNWQSAVATISGLVAKENVVSTFGVLFGVADASETTSILLTQLGTMFTTVSAFSFLIFNLLCAPCFAAIGAIKREMGGWKWTLIAVGYQTLLAYVTAFIVYQLGTAFVLKEGFTFGTLAAFLLTGGFLWLLFRNGEKKNRRVSSPQPA